MADARRITVEFLGRDVSAGSTAAKVEQKFGRMGGKLDKVGQAAGKALAVGVAAGTAALFKMGQAAAEDEQAQQRLAQAMRDAAGASDSQIAGAEKWIEAQGKALGIADDQLRPALGRLVDATGDVDEAQRLAALAMDVSAGTGKDLGAVTEALVKAQNGQIDGLSRLGVNVKDAEGKTKSLKDVTSDLSDLYGGRAAKAADTTAGKQQRLQVALGELGEQIGTLVLPAMEKLSEIGLKMVDWVSRNTTLVGVLVGVVAGLAAVLYTASLAMRAYATATKVWSAVTKIATAVQWAINAAMSANPIGIVVIAIIALVAALVIAYKKSETFRKIVDGAFKAVAKAGKWLWNNALKPAFNGIKAGLASVGQFAVNLKNRIVGGFNAVVAFIKTVPGKIKALGSKFADAGRAIMDKIIDGIKRAAGFIGGIASSVWNAVKGLVNSAIDKINNYLEFSIKVGPKTFSINPPDIPHLAKGGITTGPTLAMIGDNPGGREAVIPLSGPNRRSLGGTTFIINIGVATDPRGTAREIRRVLLAEKRLTGTDLGLA